MQKGISIFPFFFFFLILQLVANSTVVQGVAIASFTTTTAFSCLINRNETIFIVRIYKANDTYWGIDPDGTQNLINAGAAQSHPDYVHIYAYMQICRNNDTNTVVNQVADMIDRSPTQLYEAIFVKVIPSQNSHCKWELYSHEQNCVFLKATLDEIQQYQPYYRDLIVGVFSTANIWAQFFGNTCNNIGVEYPSLWYANYQSNGHVNPSKNFNDFIPFGGWTVPVMKQTQGNTTATDLCSKGWHVFVDKIWRPSA